MPFKSTLLRIVEEEYKPCDFTIVPVAIRYIEVNEQQQDLISWGNKSTGRYLWDMCRIGRAKVAVDIQEPIEIRGCGGDTKTITAQLEVIISKAFNELNK